MDPERRLAQAGQEYIVRTLSLFGRAFPRSMTTALIFIAVDAANSSRLLDEPKPLSSSGLQSGGAGESERRPVSRAAIAQALGIPLETCRRHANQLVRDGWCTDTPKGLIVSPDRLEGEQFAELLRQNAANVRRLVQRARASQAGP